jgi:hypothetical protein
MFRMPELTTPKRLPLNPLTLTCPFCRAKRGQDCELSPSGLPVVHVERIEMAALADQMGVLRTKAEKRRAASPGRKR